jgi:predicted DNA-binding transcriptional regulator AlpA
MKEEEAMYVSGKFVSGFIGVSPQTLANWRHLQKGPRYVKSGRLVRYSISDVLAYMEARKIGTSDQPKDEG